MGESDFIFFSSRRRHTSGALVTGVQTCALPICKAAEYDAMNEIAVVTRGVIAGYQVDLIGVTFADTRDMVERFDFGVARCWYDGEIHDTPEDRKSTRLNSSH